MTEQITILTPNLYNMGLEIQENVLKGYRLVEGYPTMYGWQYEAIMNLAVGEQQGVVVQKQMGRPKGSTNK